jgi:hypothetical protein
MTLQEQHRIAFENENLIDNEKIDRQRESLLAEGDLTRRLLREGQFRLEDIEAQQHMIADDII